MVISDKDSGLHHLCKHHEQQLIEGVELPNLFYFLELNYVFLYDKGDAVESKQHSPTCNSGGFD